MIHTDFYRTRKDGVNLYRTYSDAGLMIQKDGTEEYTQRLSTLRTAAIPTQKRTSRSKRKPRSLPVTTLYPEVT